RRRGEAPVFATFAPAHVLRGGSIPDDLRDELDALAVRAESAGHPHLAEELREACRYILQCSSNQAFQGIFERMTQEGMISEAYHKHLEKYLAVNTCDEKGGICAFNGTGNSSRHVVSALGLVHPAVELLTEPPSQERVNQAIDALFGFCNDLEYGVASMVRANIENCVRVHATTGGSTNLIMHIVAAMLHAGVDFSLSDYDAIRRAVPVPDLFDYSLTSGRDIFALAQQCCDGSVRGMETVVYELVNNGVPMHLDAPTVTGSTWRDRLSDTSGLSADGVAENPIILSKPRRAFSGIDVLEGNFFETAVVKISGMPTAQIDEFDEKLFLGVYFENEEDVVEALLDVRLLARLRDDRAFADGDLRFLARANGHTGPIDSEPYDGLYDAMVAARTLKLLIIVSGQGPVAFGMPEMFTPAQHINANRSLSPLVVLISDGRYSGVTYGAAVGHVTPEAAQGGGILYIKTGDLFRVKLRDRRIDLVEPDGSGGVRLRDIDPMGDRASLGTERLSRIVERRARWIAPTNVMLDVTDAAHGVVPKAVAQSADEGYRLPG
ncbi:dihydroxy-acid dehydratase, partial [Candidatus Poribacteria bacterium]|nr:dihydroxy-acid dehydratase [Candidatus Poribacteria bacterium]